MNDIGYLNYSSITECNSSYFKKEEQSIRNSDIHSLEEYLTSLSAGCFWLANTTQFLWLKPVCVIKQLYKSSKSLAWSPKDGLYTNIIP